MTTVSASHLSSEDVYCVVPVRNRLTHTKACVQRLLNQDFQNWRAIFIDDGSSDGTFQYLSECRSTRIKVIKGDGNLWWGGGMQLGIDNVLRRANPNDYMLMLNDDADFSPAFISTLVEESRMLNRAVVGARHVIRGTDKLLPSGFCIDYFRTSISLVSPGPKITDVDALPGRGTLYPINAITSAGNINTRFFRHYLADVEYSARVRELGTRVVISHRASISTDEERSDHSTIVGGILPRKLSFKSKDNFFHKLLFFTCRGPIWLRPTAFLRYGLLGSYRLASKKV